VFSIFRLKSTTLLNVITPIFLLEIDDQFIEFFEQVLDVNEEINLSYINENIISINIIIKLLMSLTETRTKLLSWSEVCPPGSLPSSHCIITVTK
jgi:hypothetical protein